MQSPLKFLKIHLKNVKNKVENEWTKELPCTHLIMDQDVFDQFLRNFEYLKQTSCHFHFAHYRNRMHDKFFFVFQLPYYESTHPPEKIYYTIKNDRKIIIKKS
jgi:hypothetical protein